MGMGNWGWECVYVYKVFIVAAATTAAVVVIVDWE